MYNSAFNFRRKFHFQYYYVCSHIVIYWTHFDVGLTECVFMLYIEIKIQVVWCGKHTTCWVFNIYANFILNGTKLKLNFPRKFPYESESYFHYSKYIQAIMTMAFDMKIQYINANNLFGHAISICCVFLPRRFSFHHYLMGKMCAQVYKSLVVVCENQIFTVNFH